MNITHEIRKIKNAICCINKKLPGLDKVIFFSYEGTNDLPPLAVPGLSEKLYINIDTGESFIANPTGLAPYYIPVAKDIIEADDYAELLTITGSTSVIYVTLDDNKLYRWTGSTYVELSAQSIVPNVQTVTSSATVTPVYGNDLVVITAQLAGLTLANPTGTWVQGKDLVIRIKDNGTAIAITYGAKYRAIGVTLPTTTVISKITYLGIIYNSTDDTFDVIGVTTQS